MTNNDLEIELFEDFKTMQKKLLKLIPRDYRDMYFSIVQKCIKKYGFVITQETIYALREQGFPTKHKWEIFFGIAKRINKTLSSKEDNIVKSNSLQVNKNNNLKEIENKVRNGQMSLDAFDEILCEEDLKGDEQSV